MSTFPVTRLRRLRRSEALRELVRETPLAVDDLVMPLFVAPEALPNERLPALGRHTVDGVVAECEELLRLGVKAVILFGIPESKDDEGSGAWIDDGIVQRALRALRPRFPELVLFTDVCLCEYTAVRSSSSGKRGRSARSACWTMPSSIHAPEPSSSFASGIPNRSTAFTPRRTSSSHSRTTESTVWRPRPGSRGFGSASGATKSGMTRSSTDSVVSRTRSRSSAVRRSRRKRVAGNVKSAPGAGKAGTFAL